MTTTPFDREHLAMIARASERHACRARRFLQPSAIPYAKPKIEHRKGVWGVVGTEPSRLAETLAAAQPTERQPLAARLRDRREALHA
jgi:hypothetical protein